MNSLHRMVVIDQLKKEMESLDFELAGAAERVEKLRTERDTVRGKMSELLTYQDDAEELAEHLHIRLAAGLAERDGHNTFTVDEIAEFVREKSHLLR